MKANILIDQDGHARLADFGLLTIISDHTYFNTSSSTAAGGTTRWMSPELLDPEQFGLDHSCPTKESDCYALGMVIYEVLTGQPPFASLKNHMVSRKVTDGKRPERPEGVKGTWFTDGLWEMLGLCWAAHPQSRPSIGVVRECLERVSGTWEPLRPQVDKGEEEDEDDWNFTVLTVRILVFIGFTSCAWRRSLTDHPSNPPPDIDSRKLWNHLTCKELSCPESESVSQQHCNGIKGFVRTFCGLVSSQILTTNNLTAGL